MDTATDPRGTPAPAAVAPPAPPWLGGAPLRVGATLARGAKRALDIVASLALLAALSPVLLLLALWVRRDGGPALFRHRRVGREGRPFFCLKFRSMRPDADEALRRHLEADPEAAAEWAATRKLRRDPRVTAAGRFLRRTSLDELPQLVNVLRGEMSLVGPRPVTLAELVDHYGREGAADYLRARPGITGLWQVSGRSDVGYADRVGLDRRYVRDWGLRQDLVILARTVPAVLGARGAV